MNNEEFNKALSSLVPLEELLAARKLLETSVLRSYIQTVGWDNNGEKVVFVRPTRATSALETIINQHWGQLREYHGNHRYHQDSYPSLMFGITSGNNVLAGNIPCLNKLLYIGEFDALLGLCCHSPGIETDWTDCTSWDELQQRIIQELSSVFESSISPSLEFEF